MSAPKTRIGLTLVEHASGCLVKSVSDSAVFVGASLKPNDVIVKVDGADARNFEAIFAKGDHSTPYKLSVISAGKMFNTTIYKHVVPGSSDAQRGVARTSSADAYQQQQPGVGRTSSAGSGSSSQQPPLQPDPSAFNPSSASLSDLRAAAAAVYVAPLAPGQLPVVQMRIPGGSPAAYAPTSAAYAPPSAAYAPTSAAYAPPSSAYAPPSSAVACPLPAGWQEFQDAASMKFYYVDPNGTVTWERPSAAGAMQQQYSHQQQQQQYSHQQQQQQQHQQQQKQQHHQPASQIGRVASGGGQSAPAHQPRQHQPHQPQQQHHQAPPANPSTASFTAPPPSSTPSSTPSYFGSQFIAGATAIVSGVVGAVGGIFGYGSDSDDDGAPAAARAANRANPSYFSGAGLLLWDSPTRTVILGQDFNHEWSDFGGKRDKTDRDAWHTASREAHEESLGVLSGHVVSRHKVIAQVRAGTYECFLIDTTGSKICRQFNDLAKAAIARGKRIEVTQMLRFSIDDLVAASLSHQTKHCKDHAGQIPRPIRGRILRAVRLFHDQGVFR